MPITFNSEGGFLNGTISSSNGDIFITTSGSVGAINIGNQLQLTGSEVIEKDFNGTVRNKKTFNSDGSITQEKFDNNGIASETKVKDPATGKEFFRSASSQDNQIEFQQSSTGAFITVSGSSPGFNIAETSGDKDYRTLRATDDLFIHDVDTQYRVGINGDNSFQISPSTAFQSSKGLIVSSSGVIHAPTNISCSGEYLGNHIQIYISNFQDDIGTTTHFVPVSTNNFEQTSEDNDEVGFVAPYDGELVKIIYRHNFDASSTTTRWLMSIIADATDLDATPTTRFRGTVTGAATDTINEVTVADGDTEGLSNMTFSKGETIFIQIRNSADVTDTASEFHITAVFKFNVPIGLI